MRANDTQDIMAHANASSEPPLLLRVGQVADLLGCSVRLVWRLASEGQLPRVPLSARCVRFRRSDVQALIKELVEQ